MGELELGRLPRHVAIIMDGNRRWAAARGLPASAGHKKVAEEVLEPLIEYAGELGIEYFTFWAWSTENWKRSETEVLGIMKLFRWALRRFGERVVAKGAKIMTIGDTGKFPKDIQDELARLKEKSKENKGICVVLALNYGGREELVRAFKKMVSALLLDADSRRRLIQPIRDPVASAGDKLDEEIGSSLSSGEIKAMLEENLDTSGMPEPDLIIRPGGTKRLSGFMLWQSEYSELYFSDTLMPDFGVGALGEALEEYARRERRFGGGDHGDYGKPKG